MAQKHKQIVFADYNLGLSDACVKAKEYGLAKQIYNVECRHGKIISASKFEDLFAVIEPARAQSASQTFLEVVGECKWLTSYQLFIDEAPVEYVVFCNNQNQIFYYQLGATNPQFVQLENITFTSTPKADFFIKDNQNILILCSSTDNMWVWDGINEPYQVLDAPKITSMAIGLDRLFVTSNSHPYSVLFSDDIDPSNWSMMSGEAGEVTFNDNLGKVLKVFALDNYIFVMRENGIVKLYGYKSTENTFNVSRVYAATSKVFKNTIALSGDKIIFMTTDGIYSFDGLNGKRIYNNLNGNIFNPSLAVARCVDNVYYLAINLYQNAVANNALVCIDLQSESITNICYGQIFSNLCKLSLTNSNNLVILAHDIVQKTAKTPTIICKNVYKNAQNADFLYKSHFINVDPKGQKKMLCKLTFLCKNLAKIIIETDFQTKDFLVLPSSNFQTLKLNLKANIFSLSVCGIGDVDISNLVLDYCFME